MTDLVLPRRRFLLGLAAALAAPAIVKAESLMKCTGLIVPPPPKVLCLEWELLVGSNWIRVGDQGYKFTPNPLVWKPYAPVAVAA